MPQSTKGKASIKVTPVEGEPVVKKGDKVVEVVDKVTFKSVKVSAEKSLGEGAFRMTAGEVRTQDGENADWCLRVKLYDQEFYVLSKSLFKKVGIEDGATTRERNNENR